MAPTDQSAKLGLLLLHALPFDGSMWAGYLNLLPNSTYAPTLYGFGNTLEAWASGALRLATNNKLIVVGCSVGGSCALEVAMTAPKRVAALVLIGTKAKHHPDPAAHTSTLNLIENEGLNRAWAKYWEPLFSNSVDKGVLEDARHTALRQLPKDIARGVSVFHSRRNHDQFVSKVQCPVIVVTGDDDVAPGPKISAELAASALLGNLHIVPSCGHYVPLEQPNALRSILLDVLNSQY